jgi:hypothetical protein
MTTSSPPALSSKGGEGDEQYRKAILRLAARVARLIRAGPAWQTRGILLP